MTVKEIKDSLRNYNTDDLYKIIVELYKRIPKKKKEEYNIDKLITNYYEETKKVKEEKNLGFEDLVKEIEYFIDCAKNDLYCSNNNVISKKERTQWRFKPMKYYKELIKIDNNTYKGKTATDLLFQLYSLLSHGAVYLTFSNWDTFRAIQISQTDFLKTVLERKFEHEVTKEDIEKCIDILVLGVDRETLYEDLFYIFGAYSKTNENRIIAIQILEEKVKELKGQLKDKNVKNDWNKNYNIKEKINHYTTMILVLDIYLNNVDEGCKFYIDNYKETDKEVTMYCLLKHLKNFELYEDWVRVYENNKVNYRNILKKEYQAIKKYLKKL